MKTKICLKCRREKPIDSFTVRIRRGVYLGFDFCGACRPQRKPGVKHFRRMITEMKSASILAHRAIKANAPVIELFTKRQIISSDGIKCYLCGKSLTYKTATIDHSIPLSRGGLHTQSNVRIACGKCNNDKGDLVPLFLLNFLPLFRK